MRVIPVFLALMVIDCEVTLQCRYFRFQSCKPFLESYGYPFTRYRGSLIVVALSHISISALCIYS